MYERVKDRIYFDPKTGRTMEHKGYATRIHWSTSMLDYLRRHFPTTLNEELAGCLGVSPRTMIRKARELGLQKDEAWLHRVWNERRHLAHAIANRKGNPGCFQKGVRNSPDTEFKKGHTASPEVKRKQSEGMRRWYRMNPDKAMAKALKAWKTRRSTKSHPRPDETIGSCQFENGTTRCGDWLTGGRQGDNAVCGRKTQQSTLVFNISKSNETV